MIWWHLVANAQFTLRGRSSAVSIAVQNGSLADGAQIQQFRENGTPDQLWAFEPSGGYAKIRNVHSNLVLGVDHESTSDSALIKQALDNGTSDHLWSTVLFQGPPGFPKGLQLIANKNSNLVLGVDGESKADGANVVQFYDTLSNDHDWFLNTVADPRTKPLYQIVSVETGKMIGVQDESFLDGAQIQQYENNGSKDHVWRLESAGYNLFKIRSYYDNLVLGVDSESKADGALIKQALDNGTADHAWQFIDKGDNQFQIKNVNSGLLLGVSGESSLNTANIVQFQDNGTRDHLWMVVVAPTH